MTRRIFTLLSAGSLLCAGKDKKTKQLGLPNMGNDFVEITATPYLTQDEAATVIGKDPGPGIFVVQLTVTPKLGKTLAISADDFTLLATNDGQRSTPYSPGQIAGSGALVVHSQTGRTGGRFGGGEPNGPIIGGMPGTGGRPRQLPGNGTSVGSSGDIQTDTTVRKDNKAGNTPLLDALKAKMMQDKTTDEPVSGLLYFPLDGKHKLKDLELLYKGPAGHLELDFKR